VFLLVYLSHVLTSDMAWRCSGNTNAELVENLFKANLIRSARVRDAMLKVDRADFVSSMPYVDSPQAIGYSATISAPHMHASACENLEPFLQPGMKVLDVGSGSGYLTAVLAHMVEPSGRTVGIDHIQRLNDQAIANLKKNHQSWLGGKVLQIVTGDGRKGWPQDAPYDAIHVGAAAPTIPQPLIDQLKSPGRMFIPVGTGSQAIIQVDKSADGKVTKKKLLDVMYVPLTDAPKF